MSVLLIFLATVRAGDCVRLDHSDPAVLDNDGDCHYQPEDCNDVPGEGEAIYPGAVERCNGINDRCADLNGDGRADPGEVDPCEDGDGDGWKSCPGEPCLEPDGHTWSERLDCDEQNAEVHPDATERPNRRDDNCDGRVDEGTDWEDADGDGYGVRLPDGSPGDCDDGDPARSPALPEQPGDGVDNDCDGAIDRADSDLQEAEAPAPPVDYGCGGSESLLFLPLLFFVPRRRSVWLLLLGCIPLTTHARDPVAAEAFVRNGLRECGDAHLALMKEAVVHADLSWLNQQPTLAAAPITMEEVDQARDLLRRLRGEQVQAMEELYQLADQTDEALAGVPDLDPEIRAFWEKLYFEIQRAELANAADMLRTCRQAWPAGDRFTLADTVNGVWSLEQALLAAEAAYGESLKRGLLVTGDAGPALAPRAPDVARVCATAVDRYLGQPIPLAPDEVYALYWQAGTASLLAGHQEEAGNLLRQAAAVKVNPRPSQLPATLPPSLERVVVDAEIELSTLIPGHLTVSTWNEASVHIDGRPVPSLTGTADLDLYPGIHSVEIWLPSSLEYIELVNVEAGGHVAVQWHPRGHFLPGEPGDAAQDERLLAAGPGLRLPSRPVPTRRPPPFRWGLEAGVLGLSGAGTFALGSRVGVVGEQGVGSFFGEVGLLGLVEAIPRGTGQSQRSLAHVSTGAGVGGSWRQFRADLQAGAWLNPTLGGGPLGHLVLQGRTGRLGLGVDGRVGWDLAVHRTEVVRWIVGVGLWASWEGGHAP